MDALFSAAVADRNLFKYKSECVSRGSNGKLGVGGQAGPERLMLHVTPPQIRVPSLFVVVVFVFDDDSLDESLKVGEVAHEPQESSRIDQRVAEPAGPTRALALGEVKTHCASHVVNVSTSLRTGHGYLFEVGGGNEESLRSRRLPGGASPKIAYSGNRGNKLGREHG